MMKNKYFILFTLLLFTGIGLSFGYDTYTFSGTISGNITWNSYDTVYINGNVTINGTDFFPASLTITPNTAGPNTGNNDGVYIVFTGDYGIDITGTGGALNASGTTADSIIFTADRNSNHVFGETGETWKDLNYFNSAGTSVIDYAVVEHGRGNDYSIGGGICLYGNNITVKNSSIKN